MVSERVLYCDPCSVVTSATAYYAVTSVVCVCCCRVPKSSAAGQYLSGSISYSKDDQAKKAVRPSDARGSYTSIR